MCCFFSNHPAVQYTCYNTIGLYANYRRARFADKRPQVRIREGLVMNLLTRSLFFSSSEGDVNELVTSSWNSSISENSVKMLFWFYDDTVALATVVFHESSRSSSGTRGNKFLQPPFPEVGHGNLSKNRTCSEMLYPNAEKAYIQWNLPTTFSKGPSFSNAIGN